MPRLGERVEKSKTTVNKLGSTWGVTVDVYYTGNHYNLGVEIYKKGILNNEVYEDMKRVDEEQNINEEVKRVIQKLFEYAADRKEARDISLDITVE